VIANAHVDHLVVVAASLDQGIAWCEATLGVAPAPGGAHPLMGTHNRLLRVSATDYPQTYLEVIAVNPTAPHAQPARARRWFDMDDPALAGAVAAHGPRLVHFAASVPELRAAIAALTHIGIDRGRAIDASRMTPRGLLKWRITVRDDGQRLFYGALPTLIEWGAVHPGQALPESGISLQSMAVTHPRPADLQAAYSAIGLHGVGVAAGPPNITATLRTPVGDVVLESKGL
jgi:hypothetical protein